MGSIGNSNPIALSQSISVDGSKRKVYQIGSKYYVKAVTKPTFSGTSTNINAKMDWVEVTKPENNPIMVNGRSYDVWTSQWKRRK